MDAHTGNDIDINFYNKFYYITNQNIYCGMAIDVMELKSRNGWKVQ